MDIHNSNMDVYNPVMYIHNSITDIQTCRNSYGFHDLIVDVNNYIMAIHNCCELYPELNCGCP